MTSSLLAPRRRRRQAVVAPADRCGDDRPTPILDWRTQEVGDFAARVSTDPSLDQRSYLIQVHQAIASLILPVYALNDLQPASSTIRRGRGSCSQRLAVLEAVARRNGIPTRVRGIVVDGQFWYPRFPRATRLVPDRVILAWPDFKVDGSWLSAGELYGSLGELAACGLGFTNTDGETLFDAVGRTAVDWDGRTNTPSCDLSATVRQDLGVYGSRDDLFAANGQTLCRLAYTLGDPIMSRRSAAA